jgi:hypothetical protein
VPVLAPFEPTAGWLKDGKIPAHTICPFRVICSTAKKGMCNHKSQDAEQDFSCASARGYQLIVNEQNFKRA